MNSRRDFLQKVTASAIALPLIPSLAIAEHGNESDSSYQGQVLRVAIMGWEVMVSVSQRQCKPARKESSGGDPWNACKSKGMAIKI